MSTSFSKKFKYFEKGDDIDRYFAENVAFFFQFVYNTNIVFKKEGGFMCIEGNCSSCSINGHYIFSMPASKHIDFGFYSMAIHLRDLLARLLS